MKIFDKRIYLKHKVFSNEIFRYSVTKTSTENRDTPPLIHKIFFPTRNFLKHNGSLATFFRSCEIKKKFDKTVKLPPPLLETFRYQNSFETQKGSPTNFIGTVRQRFFNGVQLYPLLMHKILRCTKFSETPKCSLREIFGYCETKSFRRRNLIPPSLMHKIFRYPKFSDTSKCSPTKFFGTVRQKILNEKS